MSDATRTPQERADRAWAKARALHETEDGGLATGGGGGDSYGMEPRVAHLEKRMDGVESKLETIIVTLGGIATKRDVWTALATGGALAVAIVALFVGILAYLQDQRIASRPEPPAATSPAPAPPPQRVIIELVQPSRPAAPSPVP